MHAAGFFTEPPEPIVDDDQWLTLPAWPETEYLVRVVANDPTGVLAAALSVPATDNSRVTWNLVQIALALPAELAAQLAGQITAAVPGRYGVLIPQRVGALVVHLAEGGHPVEAMDLARSLLADIPPRRGRTTSRISGDDYTAVVRDCAPPLAVAAGRPAFTFLCDLLDQAVSASLPATRRARDRYDESGQWRPVIEVANTYSEHDPRNGLTDAVRTTVRQLIVDSELSTDEAATELAAHRWTIFTRLALDLLREHGAEAPSTVARYLCDPAVVSNHRVERELLLLASTGHGWLERRDQQRLVALISAGPNAEWYQRWRPDLGPDAVRTYAERWQRDRYAAVEGILSTTERTRYQTLVAEHGPAPDPSRTPHLEFFAWRAAPARSAPTR